MKHFLNTQDWTRPELDALLAQAAEFKRSKLGDQLRVTVIATGLSPAHRKQSTPIQVVHSAPVQRTGTDNLPIMSTMSHQPQQVPQQQQPQQQGTGQDYSQLATPSVWRSSSS